MVDFMKSKGKWDLVPNNIISNADGKDVSNFITQYNDYVIQRNRIVKDGTPKNSIVTKRGNKSTFSYENHCINRCHLKLSNLIF